MNSPESVKEEVQENCSDFEKQEEPVKDEDWTKRDDCVNKSDFVNSCDLLSFIAFVGVKEADSENC